MPALTKNQNVLDFKSSNRKRKFAQLPESVFYPSRNGTPAFTDVLSLSAYRLLTESLSLYNGRNNGDIALTVVTLKREHWQCKRHLMDTILELCARGFLVRTRYGKPNLYAFTWMPINEECAEKIDSEFIRRDKKGKWIAHPLRLFEPRNRDQISSEFIERFERMRKRKNP